MLLPSRNSSRVLATACVLLGLAPALRADPNLPEGALASFGREPYHSGSRIQFSELSPDGKLLATLSRRSATVWDTDTGRPLRRFFFDVQAWPDYQRGLAFSPDGKRLACGPSSELVVIFDLATGKELRRFATEYEQFGSSFLRFSADGSALIVESNRVVTWFDIDTGVAKRRLSEVWFTQLSPDDRLFAMVSAVKRTVYVGDAKTGKILHSLAVAAGHGRETRGVLFLPDGATLAVVHHPDPATREVQFWDVTTGKRLDRTWSLAKGEGTACRLALSPDGKVLYFPERQDHVRRYSLETGKELAPIRMSNWITAALPHPNGKMLLTVHLEEIRRWDLATGDRISADGHFNEWREAAVSPDGRWLAMRSYQGILELVDTESRKTKRVPGRSEPWGSLAFAPDGRSLAVNQYYHLSFLRVPDLTEVKKLKPEKGDIREASLQFGADGRSLASLTDTGRLRVFDLASGKETWSLGETSKAAFMADGKRMLIQTRDRRVLRLQEVGTAKVLFEVERPRDRDSGRRGGPYITALAVSPDDRTVAVAMTGGHVCLLDAATGKERDRFLAMTTNETAGLYGHYLHATALAFSADGRWLAVGGTDGFLRLWEVSTRREVHRLHGHDGSTDTLGFSAGGRRLVSFGGGEALVWDLRPTRGGKEKSDPFAGLLSEDGPTAYRAAWRLAGDPRAPALLREKLPAVRLDARPERITRLVADLDAPGFAARDAATRALAALEGNARPALLAALGKKPALESERRIRGLLARLDAEPEGADLRVARAVQALELQGSEAAREVLREWSEGTPGIRLTEAARAALARLRSSPGTDRK